MIKHLRTAEFKPFVVFVKPPVMERLMETRQNAKFMSSKDDKGSARPFKVRAHPSENCFSISFTPSKAMPFVSIIDLFPSFLLLSLSAHLLQEEDFQEMVRTSEVMESQYSHLFDKVIVNEDLSAAFSELRMTLRTVETETQWVPVSWTHS